MIKEKMTPTKKRTEKHELIPKHEKLSDTEKEKLFSELNISFKDLPKIYIKDSGLTEEIGAKAGDVIKITRKSSTAKETVFYRGVIDA